MKVQNQVITDQYAIYQGDSCELIKAIPDNSIGLSVYSPPFAELFAYSDSERDLGNSKSYDEFFEHFAFLIQEMHRITKPGRIVAFHCIDIPAMKERDGYIGLKDFPGDLLRAFQKAGFIYHSKHTIWKDPLIEATRTKAIGLMHKQLCKDSSRCRAGLPDYLIAVRKDGENTDPIPHENGLTEFYGERQSINSGVKFSHDTWRKYASPVWMDIRQSYTLNKNPARDDKDVKHICPLQLDVIERAVELWSNKNDTVYSPFLGIGSEGYVAVKRGRKFIGSELKESYFKVAARNLELAAKEASALTLFDMVEPEIEPESEVSTEME
jgi:DNA modification methylase